MLSVPLSDRQALYEFLKDKTDREVGVLALTMIDQHVKECSDRWDKIIKVLKWIGGGIGILILNTLINDLHWQFLKPLIDELTK